MTMARWQFSAADEQGNLLSQPTLRVRRRTNSGLQLEPLYWGPNGTEIGTNSSNLRGNPFTADAGEDPVFFHCVGGTFEITIAKGPYIKTWDYVLIGTAGGQDIPPIDWRGDWDPYTGYDVNNGVQSVGNGYVATAPSLGIQPGVTSGWESFWTKFVNKGDDGWSPVCAVTVDGARRVLKVVDWQGGEGSKPAIDKYVGATGLVDDVASAVDIRGGTGADGYDAWTPILAVVADSARRVLQIVDWAGGEGTKPTTGLYVGATGLEASIGNGVDIRGAAGAIGGSTGANDNRLVRADGTGGATLQDSAIMVTDDGAFVIPTIATPANPASGNLSLYFKADGKLYKKTSAGVETEIGSGIGRVRLLADTTLYVRSDGSNSNDGSADDAAHAFLTIQAAVDYAYDNFDFGGKVVTVKVGNGSFAGGVVVAGLPVGAKSSGAWPLVIEGNTASPGSCLISSTNADGFALWNFARAYIKGFQIGTTTGGTALTSNNHSQLAYGSIIFGSIATDGVLAQLHSYVVAKDNYSIGGNCGGQHIHATEWSYISIAYRTITLTGTPSFAARFVGVSSAKVFAESTTFSGGATGTRYLVHKNGVIDTSGAGTSLFPGNAAGSAATGGQYV